MASIQTSIQLQDRITAPLQHIINGLQMTVSAFEEVNCASDIQADFSSIRDELNQANILFDEIIDDQEESRRQQEELNDSFTEGSAAVGGLAGSIMSMVGAYMSFQKVTGMISSAIDYASDLTEVQNVVDVTFQDSAQTINDWSKTTLDAFGMSELAAKQYAGTMGAMLKSMGLTGGAVNEMSMNLTQLAGDMASFYNLQSDEAFAKIRSGISGETEPLKQLGINMSVANLEAYRLSQGVKIAYDEMDAGSQALLRYNYLLSVTSDAQGDFSRTQDSYANQVRLLQGSWENFTGSLATNVLPILTLIISEMNNGVAFLQNNWSVIQPIFMSLVAIIGGYTAALITLSVVKGVMAVAEGVHAAALALSTGATFTATAAQYGLNAAILACPITWIIAGVVALIGVIIAVAQRIANTGTVANTAFGVITGGINVVRAFFVNLGETIAILCQNMMAAFHNSIAAVKSSFYSLLSTAMSVISSIASALSALPFIEFDAAGLQGMADSYAAKAAAAEESKMEYKDFQSAWKGDWASNAYKSGASWGDGVANKISETVSNFGGGGDSYSAPTDLYTSGNATLDDIQAKVGDASGSSGKTAENTSKMVDVSDEQLKYMRDIAEQEIINRFTTAEIKVDMTNHNNINSSMDLDGMISSLADGVNEAMLAAADGV